jgi:hypothetical protein
MIDDGPASTMVNRIANDLLSPPLQICRNVFALQAACHANVLSRQVA